MPICDLFFHCNPAETDNLYILIINKKKYFYEFHKQNIQVINIFPTTQSTQFERGFLYYQYKVLN